MSRAWWGTRACELECQLHFRIASLSLWVTRAPQEWRLAWEWPAAWAESHVEVSEALDEERPDGARLAVERHVVSEAGDELTLLPVTADRPVVTTPRFPFILGPHAKTRLYVGSPLWLRLSAGRDTLLRELPIWRPTDTFFGPSTLEGELCYATKSRAVIHPDNLEWSARRAVTPVQIRNESDVARPVERLKIPVPMLSIFAAGARLWTECLDVVVGGEGLARVSVRKGPPAEAEGGGRVSWPRVATEESGLLMRVVDDLVSISRSI